MSAVSLTERRKGGAILADALQKVACKPLTLLTLGHGRFPLQVDGVQLQALGFIDHDRTKALAHNAADILVHPASAGRDLFDLMNYLHPFHHAAKNSLSQRGQMRAGNSSVRRMMRYFCAASHAAVPAAAGASTIVAAGSSADATS